MKIRDIIFLLFCCFAIKTKAQPVSNINLFQKMIDSSVARMENKLIEYNKIKLNFSSPADLAFFKNFAFNAFAKTKIVSDTAEIIVEFNLTDASVKYENPEKENFFGEFFINRIIELTGTMIIKSKTDIIYSKDISEKFSDSIPASEIKELENITLPFTQGRIPSEPFFSSLYEPVIAISAVAVSIYLFFTVRSK